MPPWGYRPPAAAARRSAIGRTAMSGPGSLSGRNSPPRRARGGYRHIRQRPRERKGPIVLPGEAARRLTAEEGCRAGHHRKKRSYSPCAGEVGEAPANPVARNFHADAPGRLWLTGITRFSIPAGKVYLSPVIDCFDGMPVSRRIGTSPDAEMANSMLEEGPLPRQFGVRGVLRAAQERIPLRQGLGRRVDRRIHGKA